MQQITRAIGERQDLASIFQVVIRSLEDQLQIDFGCRCSYDSAADRLKVTRVGLRSEALATELALIEEAHIDIDESGLSGCMQGQLSYEPDLLEVRLPESAVGRGTTIRLSFAAMASAVAAPAPVLSAAVQAAPAALRILVVDDDPLLLKSLRDTLEGDGHTIVVANGGQEGIVSFARRWRRRRRSMR